MPVENACLVVVNETTLFFAGGSNGTYQASAYLYSSVSKTWSYIGEMPGGARAFSACGLVSGRAGHRVVVAGGQDYANGDYLPVKEVDIYDLETGSWRSSGKRKKLLGHSNCPYCVYVFNKFSCRIASNSSPVSDNALAFPMYGMASVPYGDSFFIVGGHSESGSLATVFHFDPETEVFQLVEHAALQNSRQRCVAMFVDAQAFPEWE